MVDQIVSRLDKDRIEDYDISDNISLESISITTGNLDNIKIYIPLEMEYSLYDIDDFIRSLGCFRTTTTRDRNIFVMKVSGRFNPDQYYKLVKNIIEEEDFCVLLNNE